MWAWRPPRCEPGDPHWVWAWRPPPRPDPSTFPLGVGLETPLARSLNFPPGCGPGNLQGMLGYHPPPSPGDLLQGMLGYHLQWMLGCHPPLDRMTDTCKNLTFAIIIRCNNSTRKTRNTIYPPVNATSTMATILTT